MLCAGVGPQVPDPNLVVEINFRATVALLDALLPALRKGENPAAVVVSSVASTQIKWEDNPIAKGNEAEAFARAGISRAATPTRRPRTPSPWPCASAPSSGARRACA